MGISSQFEGIHYFSGTFRGVVHCGQVQDYTTVIVEGNGKPSRKTHVGKD